jgi:hypothetical protein
MAVRGHHILCIGASIPFDKALCIAVAGMAASPEQGDRRHQKNRSHFQSCNDEGDYATGKGRQSTTSKTGHWRLPWRSSLSRFTPSRGDAKLGDDHPAQTQRRNCMPLTAALLLLATSSAQPANPLIDYRQCLMGERLRETPPGSAIESMARDIARCSTEREAALLFLTNSRSSAAENVANLELVQEEMTLLWTRARQRFLLPVHDDRWGPNGVCLK